MPDSEPSAASQNLAGELRLLASLFNEAARRTEAPPPDGAYHLVIVPHDEPAKAARYETMPELIEALAAARSGPKSQVFVFRGIALQLTKGADFLLENGQAHPLFAQPDVAEPDADGFIGKEFVAPSASAGGDGPATDPFGQPEADDPFGEEP